MVSAVSQTASATLRGNVRGDARGEDAATAAWLCALPCALAAIALAYLLGPPLSRVLYPDPLPFRFLPNVVRRPEPVEGTRYLLSLCAPVLLSLAIGLSARRRPASPSAATRRAAQAVQLLALGVVVACLVKQREAGWQLAFFAPWQLLAGAAVGAGLALAARRGWLTRAVPQPRALTLGVPLLLALLAGAWFLSFVSTDTSIWWIGDPYNSGFMFDESYAVLIGWTPLVDFTAAYGSLAPYVTVPWMLVFGSTLLAFTFAMWALSIATVLAIYGALRRVTGHALAALGLTLPVMAFTFFAAVREVHRPMPMFQEIPLRSLGPFVVAWLLARRLGRRGRTWPLLAVAGLVMLNNFEFGLAAFAGVVVALIVTVSRPERRALLGILGSAAAGVVVAYGLVAVVTLIRAGALPQPARAVAFARLYALGGFALDPLPHLLGLPLVAYLTYAGALAVATLRAVTRAPNRVLTGMLAWSALYGFGTGARYVGESRPPGVPTTFLPWSFALALLAVVAIQWLAADRRRLPSVAAVATLLGFGVIATFALDPPASVLPWRQVATIRHQPPDPIIPPQIEAIGTPLAAPPDPALRDFVASAPEPGGRSVVRRGAAIALLWSTGHIIADGYGVRDVVPFAGESLLTVEQLDETLARLRAAGGSVVLVPDLILTRLAQPLSDRGYQVLTTAGYRPGSQALTLEPERVVDVHGLTKWVAGRALRGS